MTAPGIPRKLMGLEMVVLETIVDSSIVNPPYSIFLEIPVVVLFCVIGCSFFLLVDYILHLLCSWLLYQREKEHNLHLKDTSPGKVSDETQRATTHTDFFSIITMLEKVELVSFRSKESSCPRSCGICLEDFARDELIPVLPECQHTFHFICIDKWIKDHSTCPICGKHVFQD